MGRSRRAVLERARQRAPSESGSETGNPYGFASPQSRGESGSFRGQFRCLERNLVQTQGGLQLTVLVSTL